MASSRANVAAKRTVVGRQMACELPHYDFPSQAEKATRSVTPYKTRAAPTTSPLTTHSHNEYHTTVFDHGSLVKLNSSFV